VLQPEPLLKLICLMASDTWQIPDSSITAELTQEIVNFSLSSGGGRRAP
jgi:hypothetical protein